MKTRMERFKFSCPIKIRWRDMDAYNHVNTNVYLSYLEDGRYNYLNKVLNWNWDAYAIGIGKVALEYKSPLLFKDKPRIYVSCSKVTSHSLNLEYKIAADRNGEIVTIAYAETMLELYDPKFEKQAEVSEEIIAKLAEYEGLEGLQVALGR